MDNTLFPSGQVHILAGAPGAGKTALTALMLSTLLKEGRIFNCPMDRPPWVGVLSSDRAWEDAYRWYKMAGLRDIKNLSLISEWNTESVINDLEKTSRAKTTMEILEALIVMLAHKYDPKMESPPPGSLIVIDPLAVFIGGDINNYKKVYWHMAWMNRMAARNGWTILGVSHGSKQKGGKDERYTRQQDRLLGSAAFLGMAGTVMYLACETETDSTLPELTIAPHHDKTRTIILRRDHRGMLSEAWTPGTPQEIVDAITSPPIEEIKAGDEIYFGRSLERKIKERQAKKKIRKPIPKYSEEDVEPLLEAFRQSSKAAVVVPYLVEICGWSTATVYRKLQAAESWGDVCQITHGYWCLADRLDQAREELACGNEQPTPPNLIAN